MQNERPTLAVTGATGAIGGAVARRLADAGLAQRLLVRTVAKAPTLPGSVVLPCSYDDRAAAIAALEGVELLFMVSGAENDHRLAEHRCFIDAARAAGVQHIVYTSFTHAAPDATFTLARDHFFTEEHVRASGLRHTFLRDNLYLDFVSMLTGDDGVIRGPAGEGRAAMVARRDVANVAATILQSPSSHVGRTYELSGPAALTMTEIAALLTQHTGKPVRFHDETVDEAYASRAKWAAPPWQNDAWVSTYTAIKAGDLATVSDDVATITGTRPLGLVELLTDALSRS